MVLIRSPATNWSRASYTKQQNSQTEEGKLDSKRRNNFTCERSSSAWERFVASRSLSALFLRARASKLLDTPTESQISADSRIMSSAARAGVAQWRTMNPSGKTATLGPAPHFPKQPEELTVMVGGARPLRVSSVWKEPWRRQVRLVQTRISWFWMWAWILGIRWEEKELWNGRGRWRWQSKGKHRVAFIPAFFLSFGP